MRLRDKPLSIIARSFALAVAVLLPMAAAFGQAPQSTSPRARAHYEKAIRLGEDSQWRGAALELTRALDYEPRNVEVLVELGIAWAELKECGRAISTLQRARKIAPNSVRAHYNLGVTLDRCKPGQYLGIAEYRKALKVDPSHVPSLINLAASLGDRDSAEARKLIEKALSISPQNARAHFNRALMLRNGGDRQGAIQGMRKAIELEPRSVEFRRELLALLTAEGRSEEAIQQCREMLALDETDWNTHYALGRLLIREGKEEEGDSELQKVLEIQQSQKNREALEKVIGNGVAALGSGKSEEAITHFNAALAIDKNSVEARMYLGVALASAGRLDEGIERLNEAIAVAPTNAQAHHNLGTLLLQTGRIDGARQQFEKALELDPYLPEAHNNLGLILSNAEDPKKAIVHFRTATELNPDYLEAFFNLGVALRSTRQVDAAVKAFRRAAEVAPGNAQAQYALGMMLKEKGDTAGAKQALDRAEALRRQAGSRANPQP